MVGLDGCKAKSKLGLRILFFKASSANKTLKNVVFEKVEKRYSLFWMGKTEAHNSESAPCALGWLREYLSCASFLLSHPISSWGRDKYLQFPMCLPSRMFCPVDTEYIGKGHTWASASPGAEQAVEQQLRWLLLAQPCHPCSPKGKCSMSFWQVPKARNRWKGQKGVFCFHPRIKFAFPGLTFNSQKT